MNYTVPDLEFQSAADIKAHQGKALQQALQYLAQHSPFYKKLFADNNINTADIQSIEDLVKIPCTTKDDFSQSNSDFFCVSRNSIADYTTTSGTTGQPVTIALTENDLQRLAYNEERSFVCATGNADDVYQLMLTLDRQFMAGMAYYLGIRKMGAGAVRVGPVSPQMQWENIARFKPTALVVVPSFLIKMIEYADANGIDYNNSGVKKAVCIGEPVRKADLSENILAQRIHEKWSLPLFSTYASTEMQTAFTECEHGTGGHHRPELLIVEILDEEGNQLQAGEYGEVTITSLGIEGTPLLRYRTGDICCYYDESCKCGRNTIRLSPVTGRKNQMIKYKGTTLFPPAIYEALSHVPEVKDYVIEVSKNDVGNDEVVLNLSVTGSPDVIEPKIKTALQSKLRVIPTVNFVTSAHLQSLRPAESRKPVTIIFR